LNTVFTNTNSGDSLNQVVGHTISADDGGSSNIQQLDALNEKCCGGELEFGNGFALVAIDHNVPQRLRVDALAFISTALPLSRTVKIAVR